MKVRVGCVCGAKLAAKEELVGTIVRCPECGESVLISNQSTLLGVELPNLDSGAPQLTSSYALTSPCPEKVAKEKHEAAVARQRPLAIAVTAATLATMLLIGFVTIKYVFHPPYVIVESQRIERLEVLDGIRKPIEYDVLLHASRPKHKLGGSNSLWITRDDSDGGFLLLKVLIAKKRFEGIKLQDIKLVAGDSETAALKFVQQSPESISIELLGASPTVFPKFYSPPDFSDFRKTVFATVNSSTTITNDEFFGGEVAVAEGKFMRAKTKRGLVGADSNYDWGGVITLDSSPNGTSKYHEKGIDVEWDTDFPGWYATDSTVVSGRTLSRYGEVICVFSCPDQLDDVLLKVGDNPAIQIKIDH